MSAIAPAARTFLVWITVLSPWFSSLEQSADTDISSEDPDVVAAGEKKLITAVEILSELDAEYFVGVLYSQLAKYPAPATARGRANSMEVLRRVAERAAGLGIRLGLEVVNRYETNVLNTAGQALAYLDELDHPNVGVHLDSDHMNIEESDMMSPVLACGQHPLLAQQGVVDGPGVHADRHHVACAGQPVQGSAVEREQIPVQTVGQPDRAVRKPERLREPQPTGSDLPDDDTTAGRTEVDRSVEGGAHRRKAAATPPSTGMCSPVVSDSSPPTSAKTAAAMCSGNTSFFRIVRCA